MDHFSELAKFVTKYKSKKMDVLYGDDSANGQKYREMAAKLSEGEITEEEAEKIIGSDRTSSTYRMFKSRFREKLLNTLLFSDVDLVTDYSAASVALTRNVAIIKTLLSLSGRTTAMDLAESTLKKSVEFQFYDISMYCCEQLRRHYNYLGDAEKFAEYRDLYHKYAALKEAEIKASEYFEEYLMRGYNIHGFLGEVAKAAKQNLAELELLRQESDTYQVGLYYFRLKGLYHLQDQDYHAAMNTYDAMIDFVGKYAHFEYNTRLGEALLQKMNCCLYLHDYELGLKCAEQCSTIFKPGITNWFLFKELFCIIALHTQNYTQAGHILEEVRNHTDFKFQPPQIKERWQIFEAYYFLLLKAGVAERYSNSRFRFSTFVNSVSIHSKDKKGFNASILIAELLYYLLNKDFHIITEKIESLRRYSKRHFEENENYRSYIFLKIMIECDKGKFERALVMPKIEKLLDKLAKSQFQYISSLDGIEIVPYIDLWKIVEKRLD